MNTTTVLFFCYAVIALCVLASIIINKHATDELRHELKLVNECRKSFEKHQMESNLGFARHIDNLADIANELSKQFEDMFKRMESVEEFEMSVEETDILGQLTKLQEEVTELRNTVKFGCDIDGHAPYFVERTTCDGDTCEVEFTIDPDEEAISI